MNVVVSVVLMVVGSEQLPDIRKVPADLRVPNVESVSAAAGRRFKEVIPQYAHTNAYHVTYLPTDWRPDADYPVIVEYAGNGRYRNQYGDVSTGRVEDSKLGYGLSSGRGHIWVCLPYLNDVGTENVILWWGDRPSHDPSPTIDYCVKAVPWICKKYGGDPRRVVLTGFSRGAIACNFIGLHSPEIAKLWCAFVPFSHYDGVVQWDYPKSDRTSAVSRLKRLGDRPQFICAEGTGGKKSIQATREYLESTGVQGNFTFRGTGFRNHNDEWILRPSTTRDELRRWLRDVLK